VEDDDGIGPVRAALLNLDPPAPDFEGLAHYPLAK
jgi:hypothetical protein